MNLKKTINSLLAVSRLQEKKKISELETTEISLNNREKIVKKKKI